MNVIMKKTEYILKEDELLIIKKDGTELGITYKLMFYAMISIAFVYFFILRCLLL